MITRGARSAKSPGEAVEVNITERQVRRAVEASFNDAVSGAFRMYDQMLETASPGQRGQLLDYLYEILSYSLGETDLARFPRPGDPSEDSFRLSQLGPSAERAFRDWATRMRREVENSLSGVLEESINRVKSGTVLSVQFSIRPYSEEQRQFAYVVFDSFITGQSLQPPADYVPGEPYSGSKREYSQRDASSGRIPAIIEFGVTEVTVKWPPWLYGQTRTDMSF